MTLFSLLVTIIDQTKYLPIIFCFCISGFTSTKTKWKYAGPSSSQVGGDTTRKFNLAAVVNHSGNLNSGHYTCLVKDRETCWHCNDKAVMRVNLDDINKSLPYVLFYLAK